MSRSKGIEMEPPMHLQRPSSARSQDISHVLASVFREVFSRDVVGDETVKHLTTSRSGEEGYHDKYVRQLEEIQEEREKTHREADMLEAHIMQAQASAMAADERDLQNALGECGQYQNLGLPPGKSNLRHCLDTQLLRKFNLIVPEDFTANGQLDARPPQADEIPHYARFTTSSHQRYRKTPPLTDYLDDRVESSLGYPFTVASKPATGERKTKEIPSPATTHTKMNKAVWKNSMKPSQRQIEREDLKKLKNKAEYKRNPRFVPPLTADLIQGTTKAKEVKEQKESATSSVAVVFIAAPSPVVFSEYKVGETYELMVELKNVTSSSRQIRIVPPSTKYFSIGLGRFPGESGVVAPGMSCVYPIRFSPDSLADYDDSIKVKTQIDPPMVISLQGRRPPPQLSLSNVLDCGHTLVGGKKGVQFTCTNQGGQGQFCLMGRSDWPTTDFMWSLDNPGLLDMAPFEVKPAMFELKRGETINLEVTFFPSAAKFFKKEMVMVCDNCHVKTLSLEGTGQTAGIEFVSISGGTSKHDIGEMKDVSSQFLVRFDDQNPKTHTTKELTIKNTTNVALPFRWKLFKPFFCCQDTHIPGLSTCQQLSTRVHRTADEQDVFSISPNMGTLPPHENVHFSLEYLPQEIGSFHSVAHLVLEEIPVHGRENASSASRDVTAIEVEIKANSQPFHVQVNPGSLIIPGTLLIATNYTYKFKAHNHSVSGVHVEWQDINTDECTIKVEPQSAVIAANQPREFNVSITSHAAGVLDKTLFCHLDYSSSPVYLHVRASFEGPEVTMDALDLDFGLVRLGESACREIIVTNRSNIAAEWSMKEFIDLLTNDEDQDIQNGLKSEFEFLPPIGLLGPGESTVVSVTFTPTHCRRVRTIFQCQENDGKMNYLSVFSEVQSPLVCLVSSSLYIENVFLDVPVSRTVTLQNQTLLPSEFCWNEIISNQECDYSVTFEPSCGVLQPREAVDVRVTLTGHRKGLVETLVTSCHVTGMAKPIWLGISADIKGLNVTFEMPKILDHHTPDEIKTANIDSSSSNMIDFGEMFLGEERKATVVMTNTTAIRARFSVHVQHFTAAKPPTPPEGSPQKRGGRRPPGLLTRTPNIANPLSKTAAKAYADQVSACLRDGRGAAFVPSPSSGELLPYGYQVVDITAYNDMWGDYRDLLVCMVEGLDPVYIPIHMSVSGCPLNFQMMKDQSPVLRFGTHVSGATPVIRSLRVNNTSPFDIRLDWNSFNIADGDDQLLDMLVSYGEALPVFNDKGEELLPPPPICDFPCFIPPFIQVRLREHEGIRSDEPFQVLPSQQVIPAKGHANMTVAFKPNTKDPAGQTCASFAAGYMSLDGPNIDIPGRVTRNQGMDMTPFRLDITATILPALLSVEMEEDQGCDFVTTASDLLKGDFTKVHRFILSNTSETPLNLNITVNEPFKVMSTDPPPSAKSTRSQAKGLTTIKPGKNIQVKVGFCLTKKLLTKVDELPVNEEQEDGSLLKAKENGGRELSFNCNLVVEFSNKSTQIIPLTALVSVPTLRLSKQELDFGTCLVGQEKEIQVVLTNPTESASEWVAVKDPRCPEVSRDVFTVTPSNGLLEGYVNHVAKNKVLIRVTFVAKHNVECECVLIFKGSLHEEQQHLILKGRGSYDGRHENLVNVVTQF